MGKKHYNKKIDPSNGYAFNQSQYMNELTYRFHFQNLYEIALNRVKWINLPEGCNARFLEETLLTNGNAIIFQDKKFKDLFFSTKVVASAPINVYNNPTKFRSYGNNGWNVFVPWKKGVLVWDSQSRWPTINFISLFANRLMDIDRTRDVNLKNQKTPYIITGPEEKYQEMVNYYKNIDSNEPCVIGLPNFKDIEVKVLNTGTPYIGTELQYNKQLIMNEFLTFLGIDNPGIEKQERMTQQEVERNQSQIMNRRMNYLSPRREAAELINKRFGTNIQVVWNTDNETPTYNMKHNLEKAAEAGTEEVNLNGNNREDEQSE